MIITVLINTTVVSVRAYVRLGLFLSLSSLSLAHFVALPQLHSECGRERDRERDDCGGSEEGIWPVWTEKQKKKERRVREGPPV